MGKHIDKIPWDEPDGTHTLPVIIGEADGAPRHAGDVRRVLRVDRRARDRAHPAGWRRCWSCCRCRCSWKVFAAYSHPKPAESPMPEPGLAALLRGVVVRRDAPRRRPVRARPDRRRDRRLVGASRPREQVDQRAAQRGRRSPPASTRRPRRRSCCCATARPALEVLLARRSSKLAFHGGAWVFPGGRIDPEDYAGRPDDLVAAARRARGARSEGRSGRRRRRRRARAPLELDDARDLAQAVRDVVLRRAGAGRHRGGRRQRDRQAAVVQARRRRSTRARRGEIELAPPQYVIAARPLARTRPSTTRMPAIAAAIAVDYLPRFHFVDGGGGAVPLQRRRRVRRRRACSTRQAPAPSRLARRRLGVRAERVERYLSGCGVTRRYGFNALKPFGNFSLASSSEIGGGDDDVVAFLPVHRRRHAVLRRELQRVDDAQHLVEVAARSTSGRRRSA